MAETPERSQPQHSGCNEPFRGSNPKRPSGTPNWAASSCLALPAVFANLPRRSGEPYSAYSLGCEFSEVTIRSRSKVATSQHTHPAEQFDLQQIRRSSWVCRCSSAKISRFFSRFPNFGCRPNWARETVLQSADFAVGSEVRYSIGGNKGKVRSTIGGPVGRASQPLEDWLITPGVGASESGKASPSCSLSSTSNRIRTAGNPPRCRSTV